MGYLRRDLGDTPVRARRAMRRVAKENSGTTMGDEEPADPCMIHIALAETIKVPVTAPMSYWTRNG